MRGLYLFVVILFACVCGHGHAQPPAPLPVEAFGQLPFFRSPVLSPDGTRLAARLMLAGDERIGIWTLSEPRDRPPPMIRADNLDSFSWAGDNRLLLSRNEMTFTFLGGGIALLPARRMYVHDLETGQATPLSVPQVALLDHVYTDPVGRYVLVSGVGRRANTPSVFRIDLATGDSIEVQPAISGVWNWFADADGVVRVGVDYGDRRTRIYYRATPTGQLVRHETRRDLLDNSMIDLVRFTTNSDHGVIVTNAETGRFGLYEYDFATDTRGATLFEHPDVDVAAVIFGPDGGVDGVTYEDDRPRTRWLDPDMAALQARLDRALPDKTNIILNRSRNGNQVLVFSTAADDPGTYYIFDQAARRLDLFASPYDMLQGHSFAPVRPIEYRSRDGLRIHGYLTLPSGRDPHDLPLIVMPHGGPFLRDSWSFDPWAQFLASRGYAVLQPNFRGSTGYGRDFVERGYGQLGGAMIDDIDDGTDWLVREGIVDPARVCILGASYGGYAAIWASIRSPQRYRCAVSWAGPTDMLAMLRHSTPFFIPRRYIRERRRQLRGDEEASLGAISPLRETERLTVPLLIGHGESDVVVPVDQSRRLVRALRNRADVESVFYPKSSHNFGSSADQTDYLRRVEAFLARYNPAQPRAPAPESGVSISSPNR